MVLIVKGMRAHPEWLRQWRSGERSPYPGATPHDIAWRFGREIDRQNPGETIEDDSIDTGLLPVADDRVRRLPPDEPPGSLMQTLEHRPDTDGETRPLLERVQAAREVSAPRPVLRNKPEREDSLKRDEPAIFNIDNDDSLKTTEIVMPYHLIAARVVKKHDKTIQEEAEAAGIDPDLVRAVMYTENAAPGAMKDFAYEALRNVIGKDRAARVGAPTSVMPMNIQPATWRQLVGPDDDFNDPRVNIRAAAILLKRITDRLEEPTPAKVGSIYNFAGQEKVVPWGESVERAYLSKAWNLGPGKPSPASLVGLPPAGFTIPVSEYLARPLERPAGR